MADILNLALPYFGLIFIGFACGKAEALPEEGLAWMNFFIAMFAGRVRDGPAERHLVRAGIRRRVDRNFRVRHHPHQRDVAIADRPAGVSVRPAQPARSALGRHDGASPSRMARRRSGPHELIRCRPAARIVCRGRKSAEQRPIGDFDDKGPADHIGAAGRIVTLQYPRRTGIFAGDDSLGDDRRRDRRRRAVPCSGPARRSAAAHGRPRRPARCGRRRIAGVARSQAETDDAPARRRCGREWNATALGRLGQFLVAQRDQSFGLFRLR